MTGEDPKGAAPPSPLSEKALFAAGGRTGGSGHPGQAPGDDAARILASIGEAFYQWDIASDALSWSGNVLAILKGADPASIGTGRLYARLLDSSNIQTRFDAVMHSSARDDGNGVPYQVEYCVRLDPEYEAKTWIEDTGRWFAGADGTPTYAHGVIRAVDERHAREERLAYLSRYDSLTGEMNRWHLAETLGEALENACDFAPHAGSC